MLCLKGAEPKLGSRGGREGHLEVLTGTGLQYRLPPCGWSDGGGRGRVSCLGTLAVVWKGPRGESRGRSQLQTSLPVAKVDICP